MNLTKKQSYVLNHMAHGWKLRTRFYELTGHVTWLERETKLSIEIGPATKDALLKKGAIVETNKSDWLVRRYRVVICDVKGDVMARKFFVLVRKDRVTLMKHGAEKDEFAYVCSECGEIYCVRGDAEHCCGEFKK